MILAALAGCIICAAITAFEHSRNHPLWGRRLGHSRTRVADLPLGGVLLVTVGLLFGWPLVVAAGCGMALAAPLGRVLDPLPRFQP